MGYYSQHQTGAPEQSSGTVLGEIRRLSDPRMTEEELMSVLGLFLLGQNYFDRQVSSLSGGERSRLVLAVAVPRARQLPWCSTNPPTIWISKAARRWSRRWTPLTGHC